MRKTILRLVLAALVLAAAPAARAENPVWGYVRDRAEDLADIVRFRIGLPKNPSSFAVRARATCLAQVSLARFEGDMAGMDRRAFGVFSETRQEIGLSVLSVSEFDTKVRHGNQFTDVDSAWSQRAERNLVRNGEVWDDGRGRPLSVGAELELFVLPGLDVGLYPEELADFVLGFLCVDLYDDDMSAIVQQHEKVHEEEHSQTIQNENDFVFPESFDDVLAPFDYDSPVPGPMDGHRR